MSFQILCPHDPSLNTQPSRQRHLNTFQWGVFQWLPTPLRVKVKIFTRPYIMWSLLSSLTLPSTLFSLSLTLFQPHGTCCFWNTPGTLLPQGLCTYYSFFLECCSTRYWHGAFFYFLVSTYWDLSLHLPGILSSSLALFFSIFFVII